MIQEQTQKNRLRIARLAGGAKIQTALKRRSLLDFFDLAGGELELAVHFLDGAGGGHLLGVLANGLVEPFADFVVHEIIIHRLAIFVGGDDVLAFVGFMQGAFGAFAVTRDSDLIGGKRRGGQSEHHESSESNEEQGSEFFHIF
jgi:hypothetical protein